MFWLSTCNIMKQPRPRLMASQKMAIVFLLGFVFAGVMFKLNEKTTMIYPVANKWISTACSSISVSVKTVAQNVEVQIEPNKVDPLSRIFCRNLICKKAWSNRRLTRRRFQVLLPKYSPSHTR